jgi:hypothetical protein
MSYIKILPYFCMMPAAKWYRKRKSKCRVQYKKVAKATL